MSIYLNFLSTKNQLQYLTCCDNTSGAREHTQLRGLSDLCSQVKPPPPGCRNAHRVSKSSHIKGPLVFQIAVIKRFCTLPDLPLTQVGLKLLLNVKNSTALKFKTNYLWKTTCIFPTSHSLIILYSGDAKMS